MKNVPDWVLKLLSSGKISCAKCSKNFDQDDLISVGVQESVENPHEDMLVLGALCKHCHEITMVELKQMSLLDLAFEIIESDNTESQESSNPKSSSSNQHQKNIKSKITEKDVKEAREFLKKMKYNDELLYAMGMSPEEVSKYNIKNKEKN